MAYISSGDSQRIVEYGKRIVSDSILYEVPDDDYGRDVTPHITIKFGFTKDLSDDNVNDIITGVNTLPIIIEALSIFENDKFDVVKFDIKKSDVLMKLNKKCNGYPHTDTFPVYHPHMTLAYVKKGSFPHKKLNLNIPLKADRFVYSPMSGEKRSYPIKDINSQPDKNFSSN
jgi:hypothetical protein